MGYGGGGWVSGMGFGTILFGVLIIAGIILLIRYLWPLAQPPQVALILSAAGVAGLVWLLLWSAARPDGLSMANLMGDFGRPFYSSLGQEIFRTGQDPAGRISYAVPEMMGPGMMPGGMTMMRLACASCHGADGRGGLTFGNGAVSADLDQLIRGQTPPYDFSLFVRAVTRGIDNQGKGLQGPMPRWNMSEEDLRALWAYVRTLQR